MKNIKLKIAFLLLFSFLLSCNNELQSEDKLAINDKSVDLKFENVPWDEKGKMMQKFAVGISKALQNQQFRELIKFEALKKFNADYDVLYQTIKNKQINSNVSYRISNVNTSVDFNTLHDFLIPFFTDENELNNFEKQIPLLTIFVPELPLNYFSAQSWDTSNLNQIPDVAIRLDNITFIPVISHDDDNYLIPPEYVPTWPIVVLKENERLVTDLNPLFATLNTRIIPHISPISADPDIRFLDNNFDPNYQVPTPTVSAPTVFQGANDNLIPQHLIIAYEFLNPADNTAWHRDFTYYNLTPSQSTGPLNGGKYREHIATFKLTSSTAANAYLSVADAFNETKRDPALQNYWQRRRDGIAAWTDGAFEFSVKCFIGRKSTQAGITLDKGISASPDELFQIEWDTEVTGWGFWKRWWMKPRIVATKTKNTAMPNQPRLELNTWDLYSLSNEWTISFEEIDAVSTTKLMNESTTKFNSNFSLSGEYEKIGFKLGASIETSNSNKFEYMFNGGNDDLFDADIHFRDNPINKENGTYKLRKFNTGAVEFSMVPLQVQF